MRYLFPLNSVCTHALSQFASSATRFSLRLILASLCLGLLAVTAVQANTITVNGSGDTRANDGVCTIREAVINANNNAATWVDCAAGFGADVIKLPAGTITISIPNTPAYYSAEELNVKGDLDLTSSMTIDGNPLGTTINGGALDRIFDINPDTDGDFASPTPSITVVINNLTITNGRQNDVGAVRVQARATVAMSNCTVSNSTSTENDAGAIGVLTSGTLTMKNSTVSGNSSRWLAGAIKTEGALLWQVARSRTIQPLAAPRRGARQSEVIQGHQRSCATQLSRLMSRAVRTWKEFLKARATMLSAASTMA
jgi:hypothetical protein